MRRLLFSLVVTAVSLSVLLFSGCSEGIFTGSAEENVKPEVWLSSGPVEGDTTGYQIHFYWSGWDPDGEISHFEFMITDSGENGFGFARADTADVDWFITTGHDSVFKVAADQNPRPYDEDEPLLTRYDRSHTLFMRAVDLQGKESVVVHRSFTAWTIAPIVKIEHPPVGTVSYSTVITFRWTAKDPIDSPSNYQDPDSVRYLIAQVLNKEGIYQPDFAIIDDLNENPLDYEDMWSNWIYYKAAGDSGKSTKIGDDEILELNRQHIFAVQAKDEAGAVTAVFQKDENVKQFLVSWKQGPLLAVNEPLLGGAQFLGTNLNPMLHQLPPGIPLDFSWTATADNYGGEIVGFRYGWDIQDLNDPDQWNGPFSPFTIRAKERILYAGVHMLFIEVMDDGGRITRGRIEIEIIQFTMDRNLFWVDDLASNEIPNIQRTMPRESEHDEFWIDICNRSVGFESERDVYDVQSANLEPPEIVDIGRYANIIWTYNSASVTGWKKVIQYTPESMVGQAGSTTINYLSIFLTKGGHLLTCGRNDRAGGGFFDAFPTVPMIPAVFKKDMAPSSEDTSGVNSMPYKDHCVSVIDKVNAIFHSGEDVPSGINRDVADDAMRFALKDINDPVVVDALAGFPDSLQLWSEITDCPSCFFNPIVRGFTYVEVYDPEYWLVFKQISSQSCFHPTYRMSARSRFSPLEGQAVALVVTKYKDKFSGEDDLIFIPAYSFHFGLPLWFFNRNEVDQIIDVIFTEWQIKNDI